MNKDLRLSSDKGMLEEGCMLINKGLRLGTHAKEELDLSDRDDNSTGIGCYMIAQSIELLIKGMCFIFDHTPPTHHILKHSARILISIRETTVPELAFIQDGLEDISDNAFAYIIQTWQKNGRYDFLTADQEYIDKAELIYTDLKRFIKNNSLDELD